MPDYYHKLDYSESKVYELRKHIGQVKGNPFCLVNFIINNCSQ